jgi:Apea-like HEPN
MSSADLKRKLKQQKEMPETLAVRLHRAISWLKCAEENTGNHDLQFIALWVSYNACYAIDDRSENDITERKQFNEFISKLVRHDHEKRFFKLLWDKFSGPVRMIIENQYIFKPFWEARRGESVNWKKLFDQFNKDANRYLSNNDVAKLIEVVLDRLYMLRNQLMHGGATYKSKINRAQVRDACNILKLFIPIIIDIIIDNKNEDWGEIFYPVVD